MNQEGASRYKLFFVVRHGEGYHNVKEAQVGRAEWEVSTFRILYSPISSLMFSSRDIGLDWMAMTPAAGMMHI